MTCLLLSDKALQWTVVSLVCGLQVCDVAVKPQWWIDESINCWTFTQETAGVFFPCQHQFPLAQSFSNPNWVFFITQTKLLQCHIVILFSVTESTDKWCCREEHHFRLMIVCINLESNYKWQILSLNFENLLLGTVGLILVRTCCAW